jgi:hypothetical protein
MPLSPVEILALAQLIRVASEAIGGAVNGREPTPEEQDVATTARKAATARLVDAVDKALDQQGGQ